MRRNRDSGVFAPFAYLGVVGFGVATAAASSLIANAGNGVPAIPAVGVGTGATAVASLAWYIAKKLLSGEITPLPITELVESNKRIIEALEKRDASAAAEKAELRAIVKASTEAQFAIHDFLRSQAAPKP